LILTLLITIIAEGIVVIGYALWHRKPIYSILFTTIFANIMTQSFLWVVLLIFFQHYFTALITAEILIWMIESVLLYSIPANQLRFTAAIFLSLNMNLISFSLGWFLP
jgi:hypothetical protein